MGGWWSTLVWGGDPDLPDSLSGLSPRDVYLVQKSWSTINSNSVANGTLVFLRLFHENEETRGLFEILNNISEDQYKNSYQFIAHVLNFMSTFNLAIENLNQPKLVIVMMKELGQAHRRRMVKQEHFNTFKTVFLKILKSDFNQDRRCVEAWSRTLDFTYKHIFPCLETNAKG